mmetsp:Transcript_11561/g.18167  ORF Transcript_11561/g.18167 Transcript_11561/m.18167 type:complete len:228 (-) Transcript_11561:97-780(-)
MRALPRNRKLAPGAGFSLQNFPSPVRGSTDVPASSPPSVPQSFIKRKKHLLKASTFSGGVPCSSGGTICSSGCPGIVGGLGTTGRCRGGAPPSGSFSSPSNPFFCAAALAFSLCISWKNAWCCSIIPGGISLISFANCKQKSSSNNTFFIFSRRTQRSKISLALLKSACKCLSFLWASLSFFLVLRMRFSSFSRGRKVEWGDVSLIDVGGWNLLISGFPHLFRFLTQ